MSDVAGIERINMRLQPDQKTLIVRGAEARGLSLTDFMLTAGLREAEMALLERTAFEIDAKTLAYFMEILDKPAEAKPGIKKLLERNKGKNVRTPNIGP